MSDNTQRYLVAQGLVGLACSDQGKSRAETLQAMASLSLEIEHPEFRRVLGTFTPSMSLAWAECGFPKIEPSHRLAASFMATSISVESARGLILPWRSFAAEIPAGILDQEPHLVLITHGHGGRFWTYATLPDNTLSVGHEGSLADYVDVRLKPHSEGKGWADYSVSTHERMLRLVGRFLLGVIAEIGEHRPGVRWSTERVASALRKPESAKEPKPATFKLTRAVAVDVRKEVAAYARGEGSAVTTRCLVRGHWRNQAHGTGHSQRKLIHIEPHWRGDDDAPIALRSHKLDGGSR